MQNERRTNICEYREDSYGNVSDTGGNQIMPTHKQTISDVTVVLPFHNESENIKTIVEAVVSVLEQSSLNPRIFLVDDGSTDDSLSIVKKMAADDSRIHYISFSRNFGKESALMAGLLECGDDFDALAYMDTDGQHSADDLKRMIDVAQSPDVDLVCSVRTDRTYQTAFQQRLAKAFYRIFRRLSDAPIDQGAGDFNVMKPKVVRALRALKEEHPFMKGLVGWVGFRKRLLPIKVVPRAGGEPKSSTYRMIKLALGAILSFSSWPLRTWSVIGITSAFSAAVYLVFIIAETALWGRDVPGYATTVVLILGLGGLQLLSIGIVGEYLARVYDASKQRPRYIVAERS